MIISKSLHAASSLLPLALVTLMACNDPVSPVDVEEGGEVVDRVAPIEVGPAKPVHTHPVAPTIIGPGLVLFQPGVSRTVTYSCEQQNEEAIEVEILDLPSGASYSVASDSEEFRKTITVSWNPASDAGGSHMMLLLCWTISSQRESRLHADLHVKYEGERCVAGKPKPWCA